MTSSASRIGRRVLSRENRAYTGSLVLQGGGALLGLVVQVALAKWLGASGYGLLSTVLAISTILALVATLGTNGAALRYIPHFQSVEDPTSAARFAAFSLTTTVLVSTVLASGFLGVAAVTHSRLTVLEGVSAGMLIVATAVQSASTDLARLAQQFTRAYLSTLILRPSVIAVGVTIALVAGIRHSVGLALAIMVLGAGAGLVIQLDAIRYGLGIAAIKPVRPNRAWLRASPPYIIIVTLQILLSQVDVLAVSYFLSSASVGYYAAALRISAVLTLPFVAVLAVITPSISALASRGEGNSAALTLTTWATAWSGISTAVLAIPILVWPGLVLKLFGSSFQAGTFPLQVLVIGQIVLSSMGPGATLLMYMDRRRAAITGFALSTAASAVMSGVGAKVDGINGAAVGSAASSALFGLVMYALSWRVLGIRVSFVEAFVPRLRQGPKGVTGQHRTTA